jgi:hypothetical protein
MPQTISAIQIDLWQLLLALGGLVAAIGTVVWALARIIINTIDQRFQTLDSDMRRLERANDENEKSVLRLRAELPVEYVRREDWIRFSTVIDSKLDAVMARIEALKERKDGGV